MERGWPMALKGLGTDHRTSIAPAAFACAMMVMALLAGCGSGSGKAPGSAPTSGSSGMEFGKAVEYGDGVKPSIAATADGWVVEMHEAGGSNVYWGHAGRLDGNGAITWNGPTFKMGGGVQPGVAITDDGLVVAVHQAGKTFGSSLWYEVGQLDKNSGNITWGTAVEYDTGSYPNVTINNEGWVIETHDSKASEDHWYKIGKVNPGNNTIDFGGTVAMDGRRDLAFFKGGDTFIQVGDNYYRFGRIDRNTRQMAWIAARQRPQVSWFEFWNYWEQDPRRSPPDPLNPKDDDDDPATPVTSFGAMSVATYPLAGRGTWGVFFAGNVKTDEVTWLVADYGDVLGMDTPNPTVRWHRLRKIGSGTSAATASGAGFAIEAHKGNPPSNTLWYSTAKII